jgi:hypothetical protein
LVNKSLLQSMWGQLIVNLWSMTFHWPFLTFFDFNWLSQVIFQSVKGLWKVKVSQLVHSNSIDFLLTSYWLFVTSKVKKMSRIVIWKSSKNINFSLTFHDLFMTNLVRKKSWKVI